MYPTPLPIQTAGLTEAFQELCQLLDQGSEADMRDGPRWKRLAATELWQHMTDHLDDWNCSDYDSTLVDPQSGIPVGIHVVARALMNRQAEIGAQNGAEDD